MITVYSNWSKADCSR